MFMRLQNRKGFVLIEALLGIIILSVSVSLILQAMATSFKASVYSSGYTTALMLLENKASHLILQKFIQTGLKENQSFDYPFQHYQYTLETMPYSGDEQNKINMVRLSVGWSSTQKHKQVNLETFLFNLPDENKK